MFFFKIVEVRELSDEEFIVEIVKVKWELFDLWIFKVIGRIEKIYLFKYNCYWLV